MTCLSRLLSTGPGQLVFDFGVSLSFLTLQLHTAPSLIPLAALESKRVEASATPPSSLTPPQSFPSFSSRDCFGLALNDTTRLTRCYYLFGGRPTCMRLSLQCVPYYKYKHFPEFERVVYAYLRRNSPTTGETSTKCVDVGIPPTWRSNEAPRLPRLFLLPNERGSTPHAHALLGLR